MIWGLCILYLINTNEVFPLKILPFLFFLLKFCQCNVCPLLNLWILGCSSPLLSFRQIFNSIVSLIVLNAGIPLNRQGRACTSLWACWVYFAMLEEPFAFIFILFFNLLSSITQKLELLYFHLDEAYVRIQFLWSLDPNKTRMAFGEAPSPTPTWSNWTICGWIIYWC